MFYIVSEASVHLITKDSALEYQNRKPEESNFKASVLKPFGTCLLLIQTLHETPVCMCVRESTRAEGDANGHGEEEEGGRKQKRH